MLNNRNTLTLHHLHDPTRLQNINYHSFIWRPLSSKTTGTNNKHWELIVADQLLLVVRVNCRNENAALYYFLLSSLFKTSFYLSIKHSTEWLFH